MLARSRALTACAAATLAAAVGGLRHDHDDQPSVTGGTLSVYVSVPPGRASPEAQDVICGRAAGVPAGRRRKVGKFTIKLVPFVGQDKLSDNARQAIGDAQHDRVPRRDPARRLRGHDRDHQRRGHAPGQPDRHRRRGDAEHSRGRRTRRTATTSRSARNERTFARVVPTDALEAKALVGEMQALGRQAAVRGLRRKRVRQRARVRGQDRRARPR